MIHVDNVHTVAQKRGHGRIYIKDTTRPTLNVPVDLWLEVKKAAGDAHMTAEQFIIEMLQERFRTKKVRRAS